MNEDLSYKAKYLPLTHFTCLYMETYILYVKKAVYIYVPLLKLEAVFFVKPEHQSNC